MRIRLLNLWEHIRVSFWFIPALMIVAVIVFAVNMIALDRKIGFEPERFWGFMYSVDPEGARSILSTVAGSMITVAGVTFSITIVVLNLASSQFGPRLLRNFMQDRSTQAVLGTFIATFIYCLLVLRSVHTSSLSFFVPHLSVTVGVVLAIANVGVLIFFIHHIARSIQADRVVASISRELENNIRRIFSEEAGGETAGESRRQQHGKDDLATIPCVLTISAQHSGYVQRIDYEALLQLSKAHDVHLRLYRKAGTFISTNSILATVHSSDEVHEEKFSEALDAFIIGEQRTPEQDVEYAIHQLVEVAVRALSPGVNDPYTAIACIDRLGSALCFLTHRSFPSPYKYDSSNVARMQVETTTYAGALNAAFDQIRQYGSSSVAVTVHLLEALTAIAGHTCLEEQRRAVQRQADMIWRASEKNVLEKNDREDVLTRYQALLNTLGKR